jgi:hypothetical protein
MENEVRVAEVLIRKGEDGFELNYGRQVMAELDGIKFCSEDWYLKMFGIPFTVVEEVPEFLLDFRVDVELGNDKKIMHVFSKEDLRPLAIAFSKHNGGRWVGVSHKSRWLETYSNGQVKNPHQTIDAFYLDMTPEQIEHSKF